MTTFQRFSIVLSAVLFSAAVAAPVLAETPGQADSTRIESCLAKAGNLTGACIGIVADDCLKTADSTQRMGDCEARERAIWNGWLKRDGVTVQAGLKPPARARFAAIGKAFEADTARRCGFVAAVSGPTTMNRPAMEECALHAAAEQWLWLRSFLP